MILKTKDGSHTLVHPFYHVTYHSRHGAIAESNHIFISAGLKYIAPFRPEGIKIFEFGFGSGLNAFLSFLYSQRENYPISYFGIDNLAIPPDEVGKLNYPASLNAKPFERVFNLLHKPDVNNQYLPKSKFFFNKTIDDYRPSLLPDDIDLIYYDAFAPTSQPELWSKEQFKPLFDKLNCQGCLVTFCAQGLFKRNLKELGFIVESLPGPPGKREMTRATKPR